MSGDKRTPRAFGYRRVSTTEQAGLGLGLDAQQTAIAAAATRLELPLADTFRDCAISGGLRLEQRPGLLAALDRGGLRAWRAFQGTDRLPDRRRGESE